MKCRELIKKIEEKYPLSFAEGWDNSGFLVGNPDQEITRIFLALDVTDETLEAAKSAEADMMITHHPLIFSGLKSVTTEHFIGRRIIGLIEQKIAYYAMHTNFDVLGMAELSAQLLQLTKTEALQVTFSEGGRQEGIGRIGEWKQPMSLEECSRFVKKQFSLPYVQYYGDPKKMVSRAAVCTGSGKSLMQEALKGRADVYITGDLDYHSAIDAMAQGVCVIDAGHYGTEYIFMEYMKQELAELAPTVQVQTMEIQHPGRMV